MAIWIYYYCSYGEWWIIYCGIIDYYLWIIVINPCALFFWLYTIAIYSWSIIILLIHLIRDLYLSCVCLYVCDTSLSDCSFENTLLVFFFCPQVCESFKKSLRMYSEMVTQSGCLWFGFDNSNISFQKEKEKMSFKMLRHSLITKRVLNLS